jgi:uncharacterized repeat protein (TIGR02543 family)
VIRATIAGGTNATTAYVQTFTITVNSTNVFNVTVNDSFAFESGTGNYARNATVVISAGTRANHTFNGWTATGVTLSNPNSSTTQFVMPTGSVTLTANWVFTGGVTPMPTNIPSNGGTSASIGANVNLPANINLTTGEVTVVLNRATTEQLIANAKARAEEGRVGLSATPIPVVTLNLSGIAVASSAVLDAGAALVFGNSGVNVSVRLPGADIILGPNTLRTLSTSAVGANISVQAEILKDSELTRMQAAQVKKYESVVNINAYASGTKVNVPLTVSLPYTLKWEENVRGVRIWRLDANGNITDLNGTYNPTTRMISVNVTSQSYFVAGYNPVALWTNTFNDVNQQDPNFNAIAFMNHYRLMLGYGEGSFGTNNILTRAEFAALVWNLEGQPNPRGTGSFTDVRATDWHYRPVTWAVENGIVAGIGGGLYDPDAQVTRQQAVQMLFNYAVNFKNYSLPQNRTATDYWDSGTIESWAANAVRRFSEAGVLPVENMFSPNENVTRGAAAGLLMNFLRFVAGW